MIIKEMKKQPSIYIVTSSLMKDIHHKNSNFRRNSLRVIPMVIDPSNLVQVERYIKGLINDSDSSVASGALISGMHMISANEEMIKKWGA
jgi:coatomer subunit gamma